MRSGDLVTRRSYGGDIVFRIEQLRDSRAILKGVDYRLLADAPLADLEPCREDMRRAAPEPEFRRWEMRTRPETPKPVVQPVYYEVPGRILHLDGDPNYLRKSMKVYKELGVPAEGYFVQEALMPQALAQLLPQSRPDIVVITGHDGLLKNRMPEDVFDIGNYKNSRHFVTAVKVARQFERNLDTLVIVAGACQSHFEALMDAGANYASSPGRVLIHALDPVAMAVRTALTPVRDSVNLHEAISRTVCGINGMGGVETRGSFRVGLPKVPVHSAGWAHYIPLSGQGTAMPGQTVTFARGFAGGDRGRR
ncbi:sporulation peptidase YabG [Paenibacillus thermoaerophilus]|uniref:Sporulation peptidase YabG n=1 Tax=Paenibacillus thermoaerophilus TaxID=1215385 RepID=A0ABW2V764_9BACL|nr:sporulation peptidase YabG [Paenibacillus thermoaerophilus]TMV09470.1 sporulation peptidase YabG [Paenibacillus thermoaerophilus]